MTKNRRGERQFGMLERVDILFSSGSIGREEFERLKQMPRHELRVALEQKGIVYREEAKGPVLYLVMHRLKESSLNSKDIANLVHFSVFRTAVPQPKWTIFKHFRSIQNTLVLRVNCPTEFVDSPSLPCLDEFFKNVWFETGPDVTSSDLFWLEMMSDKLSMSEVMRDNLKAVEEGQKELKDLMGRIPYMLKLSEMASRSYPFPGDNEIVPTKKLYSRVTPNSPLYAIDCEMCITSVRTSELTRISIVNERGQILLDTLVKPDNEITNYVTHYSGITERMMENVTTRLKDVQEAVQSILSPDAILVGHSMENDLQALKMAHPYCVDVGDVFNCKGKKYGLRRLTELFLDEKIQQKSGHCSYEDAWATMKLIKLKIKKGLEFGNVKYGWDHIRFLESKKQRKAKEKEDKKTEEQNENYEIPAKRSRVSNADEEPRPSCSTCQQLTSVECKIRECPCRSVAGPSLCVQCQKQVPSEQGNIDWESFLKNYSVSRTRSFEIMCNSSNGVSMLMAINNRYRYDIKLMKRLHRSRFRKTEHFIKACADQMMNRRLNLIELDYEAPASIPNGETLKTEVGRNQEGGGEVVNSCIEILTNAMPHKTLFVLVLASDTKSVFNAAIKK